MAVYSNKHWVNADKVSQHAREFTHMTDTRGRDRAYSMWVPKCLPGRQSVRLSRSLQLPGKPSAAWLEWGGSGLQYGELWLNNHRVFRSPDYLRNTQLSKSALRWLHAGANEIEAKLTKGEGTCADFKGVEFELTGQFQADLGLGAGDNTWKKWTKGSKYALLISLRNRGPVEVVQAGFFFELSAGFDVGEGHEFEIEAALALSGDFITDCSTKPPDAQVNRYRFTCVLRNIEPGATGQVGVRIKHNAESPNFSEASTSISWAIYPTGPLPGPYDPDTDDNLRVFSLTFCGPSATSEGCAGVGLGVHVAGRSQATAQLPSTRG